MGNNDFKYYSRKVDESKIKEYMIRMESDKRKGLSLINRTALEMGIISLEEYYNEERKIMDKTIKEYRNIMNWEFKKI